MQNYPIQMFSIKICAIQIVLSWKMLVCHRTTQNIPIHIFQEKDLLYIVFLSIEFLFRAVQSRTLLFVLSVS